MKTNKIGERKTIKSVRLTGRIIKTEEDYYLFNFFLAFGIVDGSSLNK